MRGYGCEENFERLARCEELAAVKSCSVPQIAMAWIHQQEINTLAVVNTSNPKRMKENIDALSFNLTKDELLYLDLQLESL